MTGTLLDVISELLGLDDFVDQPPIFGALAANAVGIGAEDVGMIAADVAFVGDAGEAASAGKNAEKRKFRQADCGRAIVDEDNFIAG